MAKYTTTLSELIVAEMINAGYSEFIELVENEITHAKKKNYIFTQAEKSFIYMNMQDKPEFMAIASKYLLTGACAKFHEEFRKDFLGQFLARFWDKQIDFQTSEMFRLTLKSRLLVQGKQINDLYENYASYLHASRKTTHEGTSENRDRRLTSTLPDNVFNLSLDENKIYSPDSNDISNTRNTSKGEGGASKFELDTLIKIDNYMERFMNRLEKDLFIKVY